MKPIFPFIGGLVLLLLSAPVSNGEEGGYVSCPGCESTSQAHYTTAPCSGGGFAWIRIDVYKGDGACQRFLAPPYSSSCMEQRPCEQLLIAQFGSQEPSGWKMIHNKQQTVTTSCGETTVKTAEGSCGTAMTFNIVCSDCAEI